MSDGNDFMGELRRHVGEERRTRHEPPPGGLDRRELRQPDDPGCLEKVESSFGRVATTWGAAVLIGGTLVTAGILNNPLMTKAAAEEAHAAINARIDDNRAEIMANRAELGNLKGRVDRIDINTAKSLRLQIKASIRELQENIDALPAGNPARRALEKSLDEARSDLDDIEIQLGVKR